MPFNTDCLTSEYQFNTDRRDFIQNNIVNKSDNEIMQTLIDIDPDETGGLTAISGFYYQFLVTLRYFVDLLDDKWDFVAFELHDDIVLVNERDKIVKFVQVKTSKYPNLNPSQVTELYKGSNKTITNSTTEVRLKDSWVDKLISKAKYFKNKDGYVTQFELFTNYNITKTNYYDFDKYTKNSDYNLNISSKDSLLKAIKKNTHNSNFEEVDYKDLCGETLEELLSRFSIRKGSSMSDVDDFVEEITVKLSKRIFKEYGQNIILDENDICLLIGKLCERCNINGNAYSLKVSKLELNEILEDIKVNCMKKASKSTSKFNNIELMDSILDSYLYSFDELKNDFNQIYVGIKSFTEIYKDYLYEWLDMNKDVREIYNRYTDGNKYSLKYFKTKQQNIVEDLTNFISVIILLNIVHEETLKFSDNNSFLTKTKASDPKYLITLLAGKNQTIKKVQQKLTLIMENADLSERLFFQYKNSNVVITDYMDSRFTLPQKYILDKKIDDEIADKLKSDGLIKVPVKLNLIPGKILKEDSYTHMDLEDFTEYSSKLKESWKEIGGSN